MIDCSKQYTTRDGFPVRILATNAKGLFPVVGLVDLGKNEYTKQWTANGKIDLRGYVKTSYDLIEKKGD